MSGDQSAAGTAIVAAAQARGIEEVFHFTHDSGLVGVLDQQAVLSRNDLDEEARLKAVKLFNAPDRSRDADWTGYVSLSISRVNRRFLKSSKGWHEADGVWWSVLAFDVSVLGDDGVVFATTNNAYPNAKRATGLAGFEAMFAQDVPWGYYGAVAHRYPGMPSNYTTEAQAEVLHPNPLSLKALRAIYVPEPQHTGHVAGMLAGLNLGPIDVRCRPEVFE